MTETVHSPDGAPARAAARSDSPDFPDPSQHLALARATARRLLGCDHLADDAVQEALIALSTTAPPPPPAALRTWLLRAVVHRCRHLRRSARRRRHHESCASTTCELHRGCDNPLHVAIAHETADRLRDARAALPPPQRQALELFETAGLDYAAIAARLSLPVGTVRSRLHRARRTLLRTLPA